MLYCKQEEKQCLKHVIIIKIKPRLLVYKQPASNKNNNEALSWSP